MVSKAQSYAIEELKDLAQSKRQSLLIEGPPGCGKSYLSQQYANFVRIDEYHVTQPKVSEVRESLDKMMLISNPVVLQVENLDTGVLGASYALLKSLEEPLPYLTIIITCRNMQAVPDTIISRSAVVNVGPPTLDDLDAYGEETNKLKFLNAKNRLVWKCVRSFTDANEVLQMTPDELNYYDSLSELCKCADSVSNLVWKLGHYDSNKECNVELAIRAVAELSHSTFVTKCSIDCIRDLNKSRIAPHAILSKFIFNIKYCE